MISYRISHCFRSEFLTGHSLKVIGCIAFIHNLNSEHCLNYIFHSHNAAHTAIFISYYRNMFFLLKHSFAICQETLVFSIKNGIGRTISCNGTVNLSCVSISSTFALRT